MFPTFLYKCNMLATTTDEKNRMKPLKKVGLNIDGHNAHALWHLHTSTVPPATLCSALTWYTFFNCGISSYFPCSWESWPGILVITPHIHKVQTSKTKCKRAVKMTVFWHFKLLWTLNCGNDFICAKKCQSTKTKPLNLLYTPFFPFHKTLLLRNVYV